MKNLSIILLLSLVLIPIVWNGVSFLHYLVEHTHTFCENDADHEHSSTDHCLTMYHLGQSHDHHQVPTKTEFYELKQFINNFSSFNIPAFITNLSETDVIHSTRFGRLYINEVFQPPIG